MKYRTKLIKKEEVANGTMAFHFEKPEGFSFKAGQFLDWTIVDPKENDQEGATRAFSITSAPSEADLSFATRMRDTAFKRMLKNEEHIEVDIDGPMGSFTLHQDAACPAVFLIGGIGITPVYSIIKDAAQKNLPHKIFLFYSNRTQKDAAYIKELRELAAGYANFTLIQTFTDEDPAAWEDEKGYINKEMVQRYLPDMSNAICYIAGPQAMVGAMRTLLADTEANEDTIRTEEFSGY